MRAMALEQSLVLQREEDDGGDSERAPTLSQRSSAFPSAMHQITTTTPGATAPSDASRRKAERVARRGDDPDHHCRQHDDAGARWQRHGMHTHDRPSRAHAIDQGAGARTARHRGEDAEHEHAPRTR